MTTIEAYYLALSIGAMGLFAFALSYNTASWKSWKQSRAEAEAGEAEKTGEPARPQTKLAA